MEAHTLRSSLEGRGFVLTREGASLSVCPASALTPEDRAAIRAHRDALLAIAPDAAHRREAEKLLTALRCGPEHPDHTEALALALRDPEPALTCLRLSVEAEGKP